MAGFVKEVTPRSQAIDLVSEALSFPWATREKYLNINDSFGRIISKDIAADEPYPPYTRSLRDGYAVAGTDVVAATEGTPSFLRKTGEILMGEVPAKSVSFGEAFSIPTGGLLPEGADAVVMTEDTSLTADWVEVRRSVQAGENIIRAGEEFASGANVLHCGEIIDFRSISLLAALGINDVPVVDLKISIVSTGDEIVPAETETLPPGKIRDVNGWSVLSLLKRFGFQPEYKGILCDNKEIFEKKVKEELAGCDVLILSGGSSVGVRDHCSSVLESLPQPGLIIRGINIVPGKPTLIAGCGDSKKLVISLPGHPLSCLTVGFTVLLPLLMKLIGGDDSLLFRKMHLPVTKDITARTGPEEFIPCRLSQGGTVEPLMAKSGYISVFSGSDGLIRIPSDKETIRSGETAEVWLWQ